MLEDVFIDSAHTYPIKSCAGTEHRTGEEIQVIPTGLQHDRGFMVVGPDNVFRTQRKRHKGFEKLALVLPEITDQALILRAENMRDCSITLLSGEGNTLEAEIWGDAVASIEYPEGSEWLSTFIGKECKLVRKNARRLIGRDYVPEDTEVSFADRNHIHAISTGSLDHFNHRLKERGSPIAVGADRFRPNIIFGGLNDGEENNIVRFKAGDAEFVRTIPCERCEVPPQDQHTLEIQKEVIELLRDEYKPHSNKPPLFGEQFRVITPGTFRVGDPTEILEYDAQNGRNRPY